jgi:hypothetical protein
LEVAACEMEQGGKQAGNGAGEEFDVGLA